MQHIITPDPINYYAEKYTSPENPVLAALNKKTHEEVHGAQMLSGHLQGMVLQLISQMIRPKNILEIGTYTGYSAICLAKGLQQGGKLHTLDTDETLQSIRDESWKAAGLEDRIVQHTGDAAALIGPLDTEFELVFIDADKKNYGLYFDLLIDRMSSGSYFLADNVLFHGEVVLPPEQQSQTAKVIHEFNRKIAADERVEQVIMPLRDGLMLIRKK
jgi:predicted O-methyltransferase YrrM